MGSQSEQAAEADHHCSSCHHIIGGQAVATTRGPAHVLVKLPGRPTILEVHAIAAFTMTLVHEQVYDSILLPNDAYMCLPVLLPNLITVRP